MCSTVNLLQIFRAPFPKNTSGRLLLLYCLLSSSLIYINAHYFHQYVVFSYWKYQTTMQWFFAGHVLIDFVNSLSTHIFERWWCISVAVSPVVRAMTVKVKQALCWKCKHLLRSLSVGAACLTDSTTTDCMHTRFIALVKIS